MKLINNIVAKISNSKKLKLTLFFLVLLSLTTFMMLSYYPIPMGHDIYFHALRFEALTEALKEGKYPIYIDYNSLNGYGYLTKTFYPDFILIPFSALSILTGFIPAYLVLICTITILCGLITFYCINKITNHITISAFASLLYTFSYYRLIDLYDRAALGEGIAFTFMPIALLGVYYILKGNYKKWYIFTIGLSLLVFTHLISTVLLALVTIIFTLISYKNIRKEPIRIVYLIFGGLSALLITAIFVFPLLEQMTSGEFLYNTTDKQLAGVTAGENIKSIIWGLFTGIIYPQQKFLSGIGFILTGLISLRIIVRTKNKTIQLADLLTIIGLVLLFIMSSYYPWRTLPFSILKIVQIAWRIALLISLFWAISGAVYYLDLLKTSKRKLVGISFVLLLTVLMISSISKNSKNVYEPFDNTIGTSYGNNYHLMGLEYVPAKVPKFPHFFVHYRGADSIRISNKNTVVGNLKRDKGILEFDIQTNQNEILELPLLYYKGYEAKLNDKNLTVSESENGLIEIIANEKGTIKVYYIGTDIQQISIWISIISIFLFTIYIFKYRKKINEVSKKNS